ncbi:phage minor capsid protein [Globicatella sanguinis]
MTIQSSLFVEQIYQQIEMEILEVIAKRLKQGMYTDDGVLHWQMKQINLLGQLRQDQYEIIARYSGKTVETVKAMLEEVAQDEYRRLTGHLKQYEGNYIPNTLNSYGALLNLSMTLEQQAIEVSNMLNSSIIQGAEQAYRDILTEAVMNVSSGRESIQSSVVRSIKRMTEQGIPTWIDKSGRTWSNEAYVNMTIRTTNKSVTNQVTNNLLDEYRIDLVRVSDHADSRPEHAPYQGKIYSRSGKSKKYPPLHSTGYGDTRTGLVTGINCRHLLYPYFEGVSAKYPEPLPIDEVQKNYEQAQKQRYLERQIRNAKKRKLALEALGVDDDEITKANRLIMARQARMREFIRQTGRTRQRARERVVS